MSIDKTVRKLALSVGIPAVAWIGVLTGYNFYAHHNTSYETDNKKVVQKADGIMAHTELEIDTENGSVEITRHHALNFRSYTDSNGDGNVDRVYRRLGNPFARGSHSRSFERDKHMEQYPTVFQEADRDFRQQMQRFKPYINR